MGPYGSVGAHIKTGRSPMAQDHFKTPPDPKKGHGMTKKPKKYPLECQGRVAEDFVNLEKEVISNTSVRLPRGTLSASAGFD